MKLHHSLSGWQLEQQGRTLLCSSDDFPMLYVGCGQESVDMYRGNFKIEDYVTERRALSATAFTEQPDGTVIDYGDGDPHRNR